MTPGWYYHEPWVPTVFIDAGKQKPAYALFDENKQMELCGMSTRDSIDEVAQYASRVEVEKPYVQQDKDKRSSHQRATNEDIQELCIAVGEYGKLFPLRRYSYPYRADKDLRHERALQALTPEELGRLPKFKTHLKHILCAVYMGLRATGRIVA